MVVKGREALEALAKRFPQLYVEPGEGALEAHKLASGFGIAPEGASLAHFATTEDDELREVDTPAGPVEAVFLANRADFETVLRIIGHKAQPVDIAPTVGAITYRGLADWGKVASAKSAYLLAGGTDWSSEFSRLAKQPGAFRAELIVISEGPYSNIDAAQAGCSPEEWLRISREVRLHHECAHVVCRRLLPDAIQPVYDEVTADVVGLICATGCYDAALAMRFLGVAPTGYVGGRLEEYLDEDQRARIDAIAQEVAATCERIEGMATRERCAKPFDFLLELKADPLLAY